MGDMGLKQKALMAIIGVAVLYVIAVLVWFLSAERAWKTAAKQYERARDKYRQECRIIGEKQRWAEEYEAGKKAMPIFENGKDTDTTWMQKMDEMAKRNLVQISQRKSQPESEAGDVMELPIEASFEASLEALVRFIHELENTDNGMFDISKISLKPSSKRGYLKGSFTLNCAYMWER